MTAPVVLITIPKLGDENSGARIEFDLVVQIGGKQYTKSIVIQGKTSSPYTKRVTFD